MHFTDTVKQGICPQEANRTIWNVDGILIQVDECNEKVT